MFSFQHFQRSFWLTQVKMTILPSILSTCTLAQGSVCSGVRFVAHPFSLALHTMIIYAYIRNVPMVFLQVVLLGYSVQAISYKDANATKM